MQFIQKTLAALNLNDISLGGLIPRGPGEACEGAKTSWEIGCIVGIATNIFGVLLDIVSIAAFMGILYSGFTYVNSGGDDTKAETAKKMLLWSFIGLFIAVLTNFLFNFIAGAVVVDKPKF
jgi:thiamine transporter ThiT